MTIVFPPKLISASKLSSHSHELNHYSAELLMLQCFVVLHCIVVYCLFVQICVDADADFDVAFIITLLLCCFRLQRFLFIFLLFCLFLFVLLNNICIVKKETFQLFGQLSPPSCGSSPSPWVSEVQRVRLSLNNCMMSVESLYESSLSVSSSAIASSNAYIVGQ